MKNDNNAIRSQCYYLKIEFISMELKLNELKCKQTMTQSNLPRQLATVSVLMSPVISHYVYIKTNIRLFAFLGSYTNPNRYIGARRQMDVTLLLCIFWDRKFEHKKRWRQKAKRKSFIIITIPPKEDRGQRKINSVIIPVCLTNQIDCSYMYVRMH